MQKKYYALVVVIILVAATLAFGLPINLANSAKEISQNSKIELVISADTVKESMSWYTTQEAIDLQKTKPRKIFLDVYTTWCGPCKMLTANTFSNPVIQKLLTDYYLPSKFNAESNEVIEFKGATYKNPKYSPQPRQSTHEFAIYIASTPQGLGYPTMVFLDEEGNMIQPISGYLTPQQLEPILTFFGTDAYKTTDWNTFLTTFTSAISQ